MPITPDTPLFDYKQRVAKRFDRASHSYDAYAHFQKKVLGRLVGLLPVEKASSIVDLGAGTGKALNVLSEKLNPDHCVVLDLSCQMLAVARTKAPKTLNATYVCADAEALPFANESFDLIFSSLAIQWCLTPEALFKELNRVVKPGGYVVFSTLSQNSMPEIRRAWQGLDDDEHHHHYIAHDSLLAVISQCGFTASYSELTNMVMWFDSPEDAIYSLKKVGASFISPSPRGAVSASKWRAFLDQYEHQRGECGIPLSYQVAFVVMQKPLE
ncbi:malonyl-ACP O-methyltransferase BioC [Marinomonas transparens]|uniref:Malonyl-[acyl-carrier protein] O-methyltransferase n=1 Tax=Marinomonas transparens TaxID=2795388 RepID=A0A934N1L4_9GAMM|nr:malonyl-ACP O-methyltransferase BioC [Marinomonas transparens]MBJ7536813.1 malonyl-ACP O-methyltransferase BioC [Marinomonas transparens]